MPVYERRLFLRASSRPPFPVADRCADSGDGPESDMEDVCGVILAGSHHWGDGQFERMLRGPLVPVAQKPIIRYATSWLQSAGVRYGVICANGATGSVRGALGDGSAFGLALDYVEDVEPRGPAGCVHDAARRSHASIFVVVEGCMIPSVDLRALIAAHRLSGAAATVVVEVERRRRMVGSQAHSPGGIYVFDRRVLESVPARGYHDIKEGLVERLYKAGERVLMHEVMGVAPRVLDFATYASVNQWMISRTVERPGTMSGYARVGSALVHPTAEVHASARFIGPVIVGPGACVEANAVVIGPASIGARSRIAAGATVSRSVVWDDCAVGAQAIVDASLLAN